MQTLPSAIVIGPQRAGTTWIHHYLASRGDICLPRGVKETFFFDRYFNRGVRWYARHFVPSEMTRRTVEVAPTYFHNTAATQRMIQTLGQVQLICPLRHPAERMFSLYLHHRRKGRTHLDFRGAIAQLSEIAESARYATYLRRWFNLFGREHVLVLFVDELHVNPAGYAARICHYLDLPVRELSLSLHQPVNNVAIPPNQHLARLGSWTANGLRYCRLYSLVNLGKRVGLKQLLFGRDGTGRVPQLADTDCQWILQSVLPEVEALEDMLELDLSHWKPQRVSSKAG